MCCTIEYFESEDKNLKWYAADFETSNSDINIQLNYTRVWLWDIFDPQIRKHFTGDDIETFCDKLFTMPSSIFYFHNLKFDGAFLIYYLLENGFKIGYDNNSGTINTLITDRLVWYTFTVHYNGRTYRFRDSMKKIIGSLRKAAEDFELPIKKGEIDYRLHRDEGYQATDEEIEYIHNDTEILADVMQYYYENGMTGLTNASDAMKAYKNIVSDSGFKSYFPLLPKKVDAFIRKSYKGGFCYLNPEYYNVPLGKIYKYDVKSMYPSRMRDCMLPFGIPIHYNGKYEYDKDYPLYFQEIKVCCDLKKGRIPSIQTKSFMSIKLNYLKSTDGKMYELVLSKPDLERLLDDYEIHEIEYTHGFKFRGTDVLFKDYINHYFELKETSKGAKKALYKIFLNSLYGKFAMMVERAQALPRYSESKLFYDKTELEEVDPVYIAVAAYITSMARKHLLDGIYANLDTFIYCDTDSMHLLAPVKGVDKGNKLGQWAIEDGREINGEVITDITAAKYLGQKCYILMGNKNGKEYEIKKIAGAPDTVKRGINMDNFEVNLKTPADKFPKFRMKNVKGGVLLVPTTFTLKDRR